MRGGEKRAKKQAEANAPRCDCGFAEEDPLMRGLKVQARRYPPVVDLKSFGRIR